jgi:peptidoglycan/xylan/chitin deacetylase (PgdA/CDA1 family)
MTPPGVSTLKDPRPQLGKIKYGEYINDCKQPGTVALTFDDGPNVYTSELLDKLKVAGAKATFLVAGNTNGRGELDKGDVWPKLLKRMLAEGHQIGSHTWSHPHMNAMKSRDRKIDMAKNERAIANVIGKYPTYMRPPYGECDAKSGCLKDLKDMGYTPLIGFDTQDWMNAAGHIQDSEKLVERFFDGLGSDGHALFCQHDTLAASVLELTPMVLEEINHKGFRGQCLLRCIRDVADLS